MKTNRLCVWLAVGLLYAAGVQAEHEHQWSFDAVVEVRLPVVDRHA